MVRFHEIIFDKKNDINESERKIWKLTVCGAINEIKVQSDDAEKKKRKRRRKNKNKNKLQENNVPQEMPKPQPKKIAQLNVPSQAKVTKFSDTGTVHQIVSPISNSQLRKCFDESY